MIRKPQRTAIEDPQRLKYAPVISKGFASHAELLALNTHVNNNFAAAILMAHGVHVTMMASKTKALLGARMRGNFSSIKKDVLIAIQPDAARINLLLINYDPSSNPHAANSASLVMRYNKKNQVTQRFAYAEQICLHRYNEHVCLTDQTLEIDFRNLTGLGMHALVSATQDNEDTSINEMRIRLDAKPFCNITIRGESAEKVLSQGDLIDPYNHLWIQRLVSPFVFMGTSAMLLDHTSRQGTEIMDMMRFYNDNIIYNQNDCGNQMPAQLLAETRDNLTALYTIQHSF